MTVNGRDNFLILQALIGGGAYYLFPTVDKLPLWNAKGLLHTLLLHVAVSETLFYLSHRLFHTDFLFRRYHSLHHSVPVLQSYTGPPSSIFLLSLSTPLSIPSLSLDQWLGSWTRDAAGESVAECSDGHPSVGQLLGRARIRDPCLRLCSGFRFSQVHASQQRRGASRRALPCFSLSQISSRHPYVSHLTINPKKMPNDDDDADDCSLHAGITRFTTRKI